MQIKNLKQKYSSGKVYYKKVLRVAQYAIYYVYDKIFQP
jgi:hypothetical protein